MTIPKIPASTAKLFGKKRTRRQVVLESPAEITVDETVQKPIIKEIATPPVLPAEPAAVQPTPAIAIPFRRRG